MIETTGPSLQEKLAVDYLARRVLLSFMADRPVPLRSTELRERVQDLGLSSSELRALLWNQPEKFIQEERRWLPLYRKVSNQLPVVAFIERVVRAVGAPVARNALALELSARYRRSHEYFETVVPRLCRNAQTVFITSSQFVGLREWLFRPEWIEPIAYLWEEPAERERAVHDALFYNDLTWQEVEPYLKRARKMKLDFAQPTWVLEFLKATDEPLPNRLLGFMHWYFNLDPDPRWVFPYDGVALFEVVYSTGDYTWGSDGRWYPSSIEAEWIELGRARVRQWLSEMPAEETQPIELRQEEVDQIVSRLLQQKGIARASRLLEEMFEVSPKSRTFREDLDTLITALWSDGRLVWYGYDRFGREEDLPEYVQTVPIAFEFPPVPDIRNPQGEPYDVLLSPDGYPRPLREEIRDPRAQDVLDEETPQAVPEVPNKVRVVLRPPHKDLGTLPLCQIPVGFFADEPPIQQITFIDENGQEHEVWLNHSTRLIYELFDKFALLSPPSGIVFELERTDQPDRFYFRLLKETDPLLTITPSRYERLLKLQEEADQLSTYHILVTIMRDHPRGADYLTLHNEVNVVRRTRRELTASILSAYPCFELHKGSPVWHLNEDEIDKPIAKKARPYLIG